MSLAKHGITKETPSNIPFGAGTWFKGLKYVAETGWTGTVLGATSGGSSIKITSEIKDIEIDGALALAMGLAVMQGGSGEAEVNFAELNKDILQMTTLGEILDETSEHYVEGFDCIQQTSQNRSLSSWTMHFVSQDSRLILKQRKIQL